MADYRLAIVNRGLLIFHDPFEEGENELTNQIKEEQSHPNSDQFLIDFIVGHSSLC